MINTQGYPGTGRAIYAYGGENASDIILMREINTTEGDRKGIENKARKHGYRVYFATGHETRKGTEKSKGGVATLVKKDLPQKMLNIEIEGEAQGLAIWTCGWYVISTYSPPGTSEDHATCVQNMMAKLQLSDENKKVDLGSRPQPGTKRK